MLFNEQFLAGMLALGLALVYLTQPMRRGVPRAVRALVRLAPGGAESHRRRSTSRCGFPALSEDMIARPIDGLIVAFITIPLVVEALRRTVGLALTIVVIVFLGYAPLGQ